MASSFGNLVFTWEAESIYCRCESFLVFSLVTYIFRIKVFLIVFGLLVFVCLFFFCTWTVVCTYKLGTRVMNSQIFGVLSTCSTCFIYSYNTQLCARRVIFEFSKFLNIAGCLLLKKIWVWRFKQKGYGVDVNHSSFLFSLVSFISWN